jgi:two-component system sensor histidine kinase RegB
MNELYAAVIHDVKNQLAELSLRLGERGDAQKEMEIALSASRRLSQMLLVHRQENDLLTVNSDSINPSDFLTILAAEYQELFPQLLIEVYDKNSPNIAFFDDSLVRVALANAIHNACRSASSKVRLTAYEQDKMLVLEVSDDGPGYPNCLLAESGSSPRPVSGRGTGLGIYLARKIAELHRLDNRHGYIELCNSNGAMFRMILP